MRNQKFTRRQTDLTTLSLSLSPPSPLILPSFAYNATNSGHLVKIAELIVPSARFHHTSLQDSNIDSRKDTLAMSMEEEKIGTESSSPPPPLPPPVPLSLFNVVSRRRRRGTSSALANKVQEGGRVKVFRRPRVKDTRILKGYEFHFPIPRRKVALFPADAETEL